MRSLIHVSLAVVGTLLATTAQAQQPPRGGAGGGGFAGMGGFGGGFSLKSLLVTNKVLQDELKISPELKDKFAKYQEMQTAEMQKLRTLGADDEDQLARLKVQMKLVEERIALMKGLTPEQTKRITQIERQQMGLRAFSNEKIATELKLTDDQKAKVKSVMDDNNKDLRELLGGGRPGGGFGDPETQKKVNALREEAMDKIEESLTQAQRKQWKEMIGDKFDTAKLFAAPMRN